MPSSPADQPDPVHGSWRISLPAMAFSIKKDARGMVIKAAPIAAWCLGRRILKSFIEWVIGYYRARGADIDALWYDGLYED